MRGILGIIALCSALASSGADAAHISTSYEKGKAYIALIGELQAGDYQNFVQAYWSVAGSGSPIGGVRLDSQGGLINQGFAIAEEVKKAGMDTFVPAGAECASSCFPIFAAGVSKTADRSSFIGVHEAAKITTEHGQKQHVASDVGTLLSVRALQMLNIPVPVIQRMMATAPTSIYWLTEQDLASMQVKLIGKPTFYRDFGPMAGPSGSRDVTENLEKLLVGAFPKTEVEALYLSAPITPVMETWISLWYRTASRSKEQTGSKPLFSRACDLDGNCRSMVSFMSDDGAILSAQVIGRAGIASWRAVCRQPKAATARECMTFPEMRKVTQIKDAVGDWKP